LRWAVSVGGSARAADEEFSIPKSATNSILVLQGQGGAGTGFVVRRNLDGKERFFVYTNQHVIAGAKNLPRALRPDGTTVQLGKLVTAVNFDLAIFMLDAPEANFLELQPDVAGQVDVGDRLRHPGQFRRSRHNHLQVPARLSRLAPNWWRSMRSSREAIPADRSSMRMGA